jgi:hypothetical protein
VFAKQEDENNDVGGSSTNEDNGKGNNDKDKSYEFSGSVGKGVVKEIVEGVIGGIKDVVPTVVGGMVGSGLGVAIIKNASGLPPAQKAALGIATAVGGSLGVNISAGCLRRK